MNGNEIPFIRLRRLTVLRSYYLTSGGADELVVGALGEGIQIYANISSLLMPDL